MKRIRANNLEFAYLEEGEGPLVLLLHGFPDTAHTWGHQMPALAAAGHHAVAPYLRGYPPTEIPRDGFFDRGTLVSDIAGLIQALGGGGSVHLVGQDWGAGNRLWRPRCVSRADPSRAWGGTNYFAAGGSVCKRSLLTFSTTPALRSAISLILYSADVPSTCATSDGVSL